MTLLQRPRSWSMRRLIPACLGVLMLVYFHNVFRFHGRALVGRRAATEASLEGFSVSKPREPFLTHDENRDGQAPKPLKEVEPVVKATKERLRNSTNASPAAHPAQGRTPITDRALREVSQVSMPPERILEMPSKRIPGFLFNSSKTYFGFVLRDLVTRICSRKISQSHVLVIGNANTKYPSDPLPQTDEEEEKMRATLGHSVAGCTLLRAKRQGHTVSTMTSDSLEFSELPSWTLLTLVDGSYDTDKVVNQMKKNGWLKRTTATYIVISVGADSDGKVFGFHAARILAYDKYKVQVLSASHQHLPHFRPNMLLTVRLEKTALSMATTSESVNMFFGALRRKAMDTRTPVRGYLFATQGLDLAIPTASEYISKVGPGLIDYKTCPKSKAKLSFSNSSELMATCGDRIVPRHKQSEIWTSNDDIAHSESACSRILCEGKNFTSCTTRILPSAPQHERKSNDKPNLLLIMLDPISRARFERSLPKTNHLLKRIGFTSFSNYTAVGKNSGPNQAALYSGKPLESRNAISAHPAEWLWDSLRKSGYATFKSEDGCIENSNMLQSLQPKVDHGSSLTAMMCYDFQRPNCIGDKSAADHLIDHGRDFMEEYSKRAAPWAAFLHFVDSHEDSQVLEGMLDSKLWRFLHSIVDLDNTSSSPWNNTMILLLSDHGMHYGPYLQSSRGIQERAQPMLHVRLPDGAPAEHRKVLEQNKHLHTTPYDVHETLLSAMIGKTQESIGTKLTEPLSDSRKECSTTPGVPDSICQDLRGSNGEEEKMPDPPSVLSYYADIPAENKDTLASCNSSRSNPKELFIPGSKCICSTNSKEWHTCEADPWQSTRNRNETFQLVDCDGKRSFQIDVKRDPNILKQNLAEGAIPVAESDSRSNILFIEVDSVSFAYADRHFPKTRELLESHRLRQAKEGYECQNDLCSAEFSSFSVTGSNSIPNQVAAFGGCIVLTGPERCANLDGDICTDESSLAFGMHLFSTFRFATQTWCRTPRTGQSPWLFDVAKSSGYVTLFGEEFCFDESKFVTQGNIFPLNADILPHRLFCRETERKFIKKGKEIPYPLWKFENMDTLDACVSGEGSFPKARISLEHIEQMWDTYSSEPKFAYLNAMAAHRYSDYSSMATMAEAYDTILSTFIDGMFHRNDAENTIIVIRGDHGLQGGDKIKDFSIQVEAVRPWTEIVVPKKYRGLSLTALFENQNKLATGFDLYHTLAEAIASPMTPELSPWTINLLRQIIPEKRTCADARVSPTYCLFDNERTIVSPNLATCNPQETHQDLACPETMQNFHESLTTEVERIFVARQINAATCPKVDEMVRGQKETPLVNQWEPIDKIIKGFDQARVSGGIFLYPRQAKLLSSMVKLLSEVVYKREKRPLNVCETGFGGGHSAALFLEASNNTRLYSFDKFDRPYQIPVVKYLDSQFPGRVFHFRGNSCQTVPPKLSPWDGINGTVRCDFLHGSSMCSSDNVDLVANAQCGTILTSTAMHSLTDRAVYFGPNAQWSFLQKRGCVRDITCFNEETGKLDRPLIFSGSGSTFSHKFCVSITTGRCRSIDNEPIPPFFNPERPCENEMAQITRSFDLEQICPEYRTETPSTQK